jgi:short-subunit dehydrogenase
MKRTIAHQVALVTGASRGIGEAVARAVVARGGRVALVGRTETPLAALVEQLGAEHAHAFPLDVADRSALAELPARVVKRFGRLDIVVNNAGVNHRGPVLERTAEELAEIVEVNLVAPIVLTHAALRVLSPTGIIVNVASLAGKIPVPHEATYSGSKFGLRAFARALDHELTLDGSKVRVATVCPGPVDTAFFGDDLSRVPDLVFSQPMSSATEIADAVLRVIEELVHQEEDVPSVSGWLATLGYLSPRTYAAALPLLERIGARNKRRFELRRART